MTGSPKLTKGDVITDPSEIFYRRAFRKDRKYVDPKTGLATSRAFTPRPKDKGKLSVDLCRLSTKEKAIGDINRFALFIIKNRTIIDIGLQSVYDPLTNYSDGFDNLAHCLIGTIPEEDESLAGILARSSSPAKFF